MKPFLQIVFILILLTACREEEVLMTGSITGKMRIYDQTHAYLSDHSGIEVSLMQGNSLVATDITNAYGSYLFENVPYGRYRIFLSKEKYIHAWKPPFFNHVGGYGATYINQSIYEVPTYELTLDSISYHANDPAFIIHLKVNGDTTIVRNSYGYPFIAYADTTNSVSGNNYISKGYGILRDYLGYSYSSKVAVYGYLSRYNLAPRIEDVFTDTVYLRIYPMANGQGYMGSGFYPEALGTPSNVIRFVLDDLVGK
ncbi:MAG: carboxypeptidase-like regulatory domain-containing protein [Bacteroidales bacterium]